MFLLSVPTSSAWYRPPSHFTFVIRLSPKCPIEPSLLQTSVHFHTQPDWSFHDAILIIPLYWRYSISLFIKSKCLNVSDKILQKSHILPPHILYSLLQTYSFSRPSLTVAFSRKSFLTIVGWIDILHFSDHCTLLFFYKSSEIKVPGG